MHFKVGGKEPGLGKTKTAGEAASESKGGGPGASLPTALGVAEEVRIDDEWDSLKPHG